LTRCQHQLRNSVDFATASRCDAASDEYLYTQHDNASQTPHVDDLTCATEVPRAPSHAELAQQARKRIGVIAAASVIETVTTDALLASVDELEACDVADSLVAEPQAAGPAAAQAKDSLEEVSSAPAAHGLTQQLDQQAQSGLQGAQQQDRDLGLVEAISR
jgi:hypothetical protein